MIGQGKFSADVARGCQLLTQLRVGSYRNFSPNTDRSTTDFLRGSETYLELYKRYLSCQAFDLILNDGAIMFFRRNTLDKTLLSYGYLESPYVGSSYNAFVADLEIEDEDVDVWNNMRSIARSCHCVRT